MLDPDTTRDRLFTRSYVLMLVGIVGAFVNFALLLPVVPAWAEHLGASEAGVGATTTVMMAACVAGQFGMPWVLRRFGFVVPYVAGLLLMGLPALVLPWATAVEAVYVVQAVRGVGFGALVVSGSALSASLTAPHLRGRAVGMYGVSLAAAQIPALPAGIPLTGSIGWASVFLLAGAAAVLVAPLAARIRQRQTDTGTPDSTASVPAGTGPGRPWQMPAVVLFATSLAYGAVGTFLGLGIGNTTAVFWALLVVSAGQMVGRAWAGAVSDRRGVGPLLAPMTALSALGTALMAGAMTEAGDLGWLPGGLAGAVANDFTAVVGAALFGLGFGALQNDTFVLMVDRAGAARLGGASTVWNVGYDAGTGLGSIVVGGLAAVTGLAGGFGALAAAALVLLPLALAMGVTEARARRATREATPAA
ncbi:MFS transporter [Kytococcus sp. Marseille-QA3725]